MTDQCLQGLAWGFVRPVYGWSSGSDPQNLVPGFMNETGCEYGNFDNFQKRIEKFENDLQMFKLNSKESFYFAIL